MAPPYAILFLDYLETNFLDNSTFKPWLWWCYIDDIFLIWEHGEDELNFINSLNDFHPNINFTSDWSKESINFFDVQLKINGDKISTDLYVKPTDTHQYLHASSCHAFHTKRSIPYGQAHRLNRICSDNNAFEGWGIQQNL